MKQRVIGFDLARAYAIFGMFVVNFNMLFGTLHDQSSIGQFLSLFNGNSSTIFVILAGMGIALMSNRGDYAPDEKIKLRNTVLKRAVFLLVFGHILNLFWPADILHFYGWYMCMAAFILFLKKRYYIWLAILVVLVFHLLVLLIPYETGWNFENFEYKDFYTLNGFLRNTFYNGWNAVFPWLAYFLLGMYLGRLNWSNTMMQRKMFFIGLAFYLAVAIVQLLSNHMILSEKLHLFIHADYLPPFLPFLIGTVGFALMMISTWMYLGNKIREYKAIKNLATMGKMTLTHYVAHIIIGMILFLKSDNSPIVAQAKQQPIYILLFCVVYFLLSYSFSLIWSKYFRNGPLETIMRKISS